MKCVMYADGRMILFKRKIQSMLAVRIMRALTQLEEIGRGGGILRARHDYPIEQPDAFPYGSQKDA